MQRSALDAYAGRRKCARVLRFAPAFKGRARVFPRVFPRGSRIPQRRFHVVSRARARVRVSHLNNLLMDRQRAYPPRRMQGDRQRAAAAFYAFT